MVKKSPNLSLHIITKMARLVG